jgi:hypothetical protein
MSHQKPVIDKAFGQTRLEGMIWLVDWQLIMHSLSLSLVPL